MVKFELLSDNLVNILRNIVDNQNIAKYLTYLQDNPLSQPDVPNPRSLMSGDTKKVFPFPFNINGQTQQDIQIHVFYPRSKISNRIVQNTTIIFDVVCHKNLWLFNDGNPSIRPYKLATEILNTFDEKSIGTIGKLVFSGFDHIIFNDDYHAISLTATMVGFGSSQP
jgi:hypothetical protein